ncbi:cytochrome c [Cesiribacter sp. SM1]|uniref:c-type cytochrome n=1 Tax=Cesiribacter sp. SM1 TaxID=2861196 RepID=UPI001CD7DA0B|nr:cytochrome c [Cesiribacter sp. SM1]
MKLKFTLLIFVLMMAAACSSRKGVPYTEPLQTREQEVLQGKVLYDRYCNTCHPGGSSGLGPALNNKPLPGFLIRYQIRHGLGVMPAFSKEVIPPEDSKKIVAYMKAVRKLD